MPRDVYEASGRIGGRCWTGRGDFADGQIYEHGGELIDTDHMAMQAPRAGARPQLDNLYKAETNGTEQLGYFFGKPYTFDADDRRLEGGLAADPLGHHRGGLPDALQLVHAARPASSTTCRSTTRSSTTCPAGTARRSGRCSTSPTTSSTAPRRRCRAR